MSRNAYITEAFKQFNTLVEEEELITREEMPIYDVNAEKVHDFLDTVGDDSDLTIIDLEAEAEEDLKQSYVGKVILDCNMCHSNIFINKDEVVVDEEGLVNEQLECPYCMSNEGYTIIGQVEPYTEETEEEVESESDIEIEETPSEEEVIEDETDEIVEESLNECGDPDKIEEELELDGEPDLRGVTELRHRDDKEGVEEIRGTANTDLSGTDDLHESIEDVSVTTEDETMTMTTKEDGGVVIETSPLEEVIDDSFEEEIVEEPEIEPGDEIVAPITDEDEEEIELNSEVDALENEDIEALEEPEDVDEVEVTDFDEESFDELGESYLKEHYDNVAGFKTVNAKIFENSLIVEGVIRFTSGSSKGTSFVFEAIDKENSNVLFEGYNKQISRGKKTFKLNCSLTEGCIKPQKMNYNYVTKNELNESVRVNGTVKVK